MPKSLPNAHAFILAGRAVFTVENTASGRHFTFKVTANDRDEGPSHFVAVLTGPNNQADYTYLGCLWEGERYGHGSSSPIGRDALSAKAFSWLFSRLAAGAALPPTVGVYHEGRCGRCGRPLTDPESVRSGFGPICAGRI